MKIPKKVLKAISMVTEYSIANEQKHFEESGKPRNHIFRDVRKIECWLKSIKK